MSLNTSSPSWYRERWRFPPKKQRRPELPKCILLISVIFVLGFCGAMLFLHSLAKDRTVKTSKSSLNKESLKNARLALEECRKVCTTQDCLKTAVDMMNRIDFSVHPCNDFYTFSCGKYDEISTMKSKRERFMRYISEGIKNVIIEIIQNIPKDLPENTPGHSASKLRNLFDSCMSFHSTEEMAIPTALKYVEYLGTKNWPRLNSEYQFINPDLNEVIVRLTLYDVNAFFSFEMPRTSRSRFEKELTGRNNSDAVEIKVESARSSFFLSAVTGKRKAEYIMEDILDYFEMPEEMINSTIQEILEFDEALTDIQQASRDRHMACSLNSSLSCLSYNFDCSTETNMELEMWCDAAEKVMDTIGVREKYQNFSIILVDKFYFEDVKALVDRTSHRTIAHGFALLVFMRNLWNMNYRFQSLDDIYSLNEVMTNFQDYRPILCFSRVLVYLPGLVGAGFYSKVYSGRLQQEGKEIYTDIQKYLISLTRNVTWMDQDTQTTLEEELWRVRITPDDDLSYIANARELDEFYKELQITEESFLGNMMELQRFRLVSRLLYHDDRRLLLAHIQPMFHFNPSCRGEVIVMDFSSFIYPLIAKNRPRYLNLGFFGSIVAHELAHAVEMFIHNRENMSSTSESKLREKKKCLIDQYSEHQIGPNEKIDESLTSDENMADYFSIRPIYQAVRRYQEDHGVENALPGLHLNVEQLFFISFAQWWCGNSTPETMRLFPKNNYSTGKYRVLGIMKNFVPFAEAFNCSLGSPMNPVEKCAF